MKTTSKKNNNKRDNEVWETSEELFLSLTTNTK